MAFHCACLSERLKDIRQDYSSSPAAFWRKLLFAAFWLSIAFFPIGYGYREVMPLLCLVFLLLYYRAAWSESALARLKVAWLFMFAALMTLTGVIFSTHPLASLLHAGSGLNKAFILPFIAMECARDLRDLRRLVWACVFACFWQGLDGLWQAYTGQDFIMGYPPHAGRLTGSLGDYTVGNYLALCLIPAFGVWFALREKLDFWATLLICAALFWPALFLFQGASSRSGILAIASALGVWAILTCGLRNPRWLLWFVGAVALFAVCQPGRLAPASVVNDNRWDLWRLGFKVFWEHPWFGAGAGQYNTVFREMGLAPVNEVITISHPHNLYLDILYAHGIFGFACGMIFLFGFLFWGLRRLLPALRNCSGQNLIYWRLTAWFWLGYLGWLVNGVFGHDLYRIWWLAQAMTSMGIMIGAIVSAQEVVIPD